MLLLRSVKQFQYYKQCKECQQGKPCQQCHQCKRGGTSISDGIFYLVVSLLYPFMKIPTFCVCDYCFFLYLGNERMKLLRKLESRFFTCRHCVCLVLAFDFISGPLSWEPLSEFFIITKYGSDRFFESA